jgi:tetratricopeptide (TPR) repeat protein
MPSQTFGGSNHAIASMEFYPTTYLIFMALTKILVAVKTYPTLSTMYHFRLFLTQCLLFLCLTAFAQQDEQRLADQYFQDGEFEKSAILYEKLYNASNSDYFFTKFTESLLALNQYQRCEDAIKKDLKKNPKNIHLYVAYGNLLERQGKTEEAKEQYERAIKKLPTERFFIARVADAFADLTKYDYAIETYEKGGDIIKDKYIFSYYLADLYKRKGDIPKMITNYLNSLNANPGSLGTIKTYFQRYLGESDYNELQTQLYARIQETDEATHFPELLSWVFMQRKDYKNALRQMKAIDRKLNENGARVFNLANIAADDKDYDSAVAAYEYIITEKGKENSFYIDAKHELLNAKKRKLTEGYTYTKEDLLGLEQDYEVFLTEFGKKATTAPILLELSNLEAVYLNNLPKAIDILKETIDFPGISPMLQAQAKIALGDDYLMQDEVWEATLLYSQVDKAFKDDLLGQEARFRNARLAYFNGDFQWAQAQFNVLKASTSKLIANDALDLSVFIMENSGLDTTTAPLKLYSEAELFVFQNKFEAAFLKLDTLNKNFPEHSLDDDVLYLKAQVCLKKRDYPKAAELFQKIITNYPEEIRADNSLFALATLYENQLNDKEKAKAMYEKIFTDYSGSTFAVDARKRFRKLRGDTLN